MGRPSEYSEEVAAEICERIGHGESLRAICRDEALPSERAVMRWLGANESFRQQYALARARQMDHYAQEIVEIADDGRGDTWVDDDGVEHVNSDVVQRSKLRVDTRKWLMSKLAPKKYGDALKLEATGADGAPLVPPSFRVEFVKPEDDGDKG